MASTYVNDLRLNEMATGDQSGSWGTVTNTNLELIGEAFSFGTEAITTNANTHTTTIADGASDPGRAMFLKYTGTLDSACTITIGPNTVSKMWFIENATSGSQNIIISQGSGANVTIAAGQTKAVYSDGAGAGAAFVDAFAALSVAGVSPTELGVLDGLTASTAELNYNDISTLGQVQASKVLTADSNSNITMTENSKLRFGTALDLQIYHDGSTSYIDDAGTGNLVVKTNGGGILLLSGSENLAKFVSDGDVQLYYDNALKFATTAGGVSVTGTVDTTGTITSGGNIITGTDTGKIMVGASNDLQIYHDGSNSYIDDTGTGNLRIKGQQIDILTGSGENAAYFETNGTARLYYDNSIKIATTTSGVDITGTAVTDGVTVDGTLDIEEVYEKVNVSNGTTGAITFNTLEQGVNFYNVNQTANRTINFSNVNANLAIGQSVTCSILMAQGTTAYYLNAYQVDGSAVTPKWSGGSAPTAGNASSIDVYTFTIIKTANATFTVLASQTQFA